MTNFTGRERSLKRGFLPMIVNACVNIKMPQVRDILLRSAAVRDVWHGSTAHPTNPAENVPVAAILLCHGSETIESKELEHEHGKWVYSFHIRGSDKLIHEVQVDAWNGKIVSRKIESQAQEAAEAVAEKKKHLK